jgi:hypothetical protein
VFAFYPPDCDFQVSTFPFLPISLEFSNDGSNVIIIIIIIAAMVVGGSLLLYP